MQVGAVCQCRAQVCDVLEVSQLIEGPHAAALENAVDILQLTVLAWEEMSLAGEGIECFVVFERRSNRVGILRQCRLVHVVAHL